MRNRNLFKSVAASVALVALVLLSPAKLGAHCDGMDGPVVKAAQKALDGGNVALVLIWVQEKDANEITQAFNKTLAVRTLGSGARELADRYFFETLVRIHRAGEGAPYTGLKPAGRDLGPAIPATDKALDDGDVEPLVKLLSSAVQEGVREHFERALHAKKDAAPNDVKAGREFVEAYVQFVHYVEALYETATSPARGHYPETAER